MKLVRVSKALDSYRAIKKLYKQAFPADERAPFWLLMRKANSSSADFWALYDEEKWVGMAYVVKHKRLSYIFYLAIQAGERNSGYGRKMMQMLQDYYAGNKIFLALETLDETADNYEQRVRRHSFYEKCGLSDMPYRLKEATVIYNVMGVGGVVEPKEYREMMERYLGKFLCRLAGVRMMR